MYIHVIPGAEVLEGHDLKAVGSDKQVLSRVQREPCLSGVNEVYDGLHHGRGHILQTDLREPGLHQGTREHGPEVRTHGGQQDSRTGA